MDGVSLGGVLINGSMETSKMLVYMHGIDFKPECKIPELIEFSNEIKAKIVIFNYRGYTYSEPAPQDEAKIQLDA